MQTWLIEPRDPLIVRDGRPFSADIAGARATSLDFPFPSTTTGGVRTREGANKGFAFRPNEDEAAEKLRVERLIKDLKETVRVLGPILVELNAEGEIRDWFMPAPADALWTNLKAREGESVPKDQAKLIRLCPLQMPSSAFTNMPSENLRPIGTWEDSASLSSLRRAIGNHRYSKNG